jgi:hypothetical protein
MHKKPTCNGQVSLPQPTFMYSRLHICSHDLKHCTCDVYISLVTLNVHLYNTIWWSFHLVRCKITHCQFCWSCVGNYAFRHFRYSTVYNLSSCFWTSQNDLLSQFCKCYKWNCASQGGLERLKETQLQYLVYKDVVTYYYLNANRCCSIIRSN